MLSTAAAVVGNFYDLPKELGRPMCEKSSGPSAPLLPLGQ